MDIQGLGECFERSRGLFGVLIVRIIVLGYIRGAPVETYSKLIKGGFIGEHMGVNIGAIKGDARSLDYSSF